MTGPHAFPVPRGYFFGVLGFAGFFFPCGFAGFCFLAISRPPFQADFTYSSLQQTLRDDIIPQYCPDVSSNTVRLWCVFGELTAQADSPSVCAHTWDGEAA